jgi:monoamine oxidase
MLDVAIVGAGLCGLALAKSLRSRCRPFEVFEARSRLGGRILSVSGDTGVNVDLGPTWFWPQTQPLISKLIEELGVLHFEQYDQGTALHLGEADKSAKRIDDKRFHEGARRVRGGMATLVAALAKDLPLESLHLGHELKSLRDCGDHIVLTFWVGEQAHEIAARRVVLAMPPRLVRENIVFEPALDEPADTALLGAETWMAAQAKVVIEYRDKFWRDAGLSGSGFVTHEQAVVGEIFDACDDDSNLTALGGFIALSPDLRESFSAGLPLLMASQMNQVFGIAAEHGEIHYQDWAKEALTCSFADRSATDSDHTGDAANPMLRRALWDKKLYLGGSETAARGAGYLEGALDAARRIDRALSAIETKSGFSHMKTDEDCDMPMNDASLARFSEWVAAQSDAVFEDYRRRLNRALAAQERENITQLAALGAMEEVFQRALHAIDGLSFDMSNVSVERGRIALTPEIQRPFGDLMQTLIDDVTAFNQTSCALSNFPSEHRLSKDYVQAILRDVAAAWQEFSLSANGLLLEKKRAQRAQEEIG